MRKITIMVAMLAIGGLASVPAIAQTYGQVAVSGDVDQSYQVINTGDNSAVASEGSFFANTGNTQTQQVINTFHQYDN